MSDDNSTSNATSRLFQIHEADLAELERLVPALCEHLWRPDMTNKERVQTRKVQEILSKVRWNYGPPSEVHIVPTGE